MCPSRAPQSGTDQIEFTPVQDMTCLVLAQTSCLARVPELMGQGSLSPKFLLCLPSADPRASLQLLTKQAPSSPRLVHLLFHLPGPFPSLLLFLAFVSAFPEHLVSKAPSPETLFPICLLYFVYNTHHCVKSYCPSICLLVYFLPLDSHISSMIQKNVSAPFCNVSSEHCTWESIGTISSSRTLRDSRDANL